MKIRPKSIVGTKLIRPVNENSSLDPIFVVEFIEGISQFSVKGNKDAKLQCKFNYQLSITIDSLLTLQHFLPGLTFCYSDIPYVDVTTY